VLRNKIFVATIFILLVMVVGYNIKYIRARNARFVSSDGDPSNDNASMAAEQGRGADVIHSDTRADNTKVLVANRDPFLLGHEVQGEPETPADAKAGGQAQSGIVLYGIACGESTRPLALINHRVVSEGDSVGGAKVTKIMQKKVVLQKGDEELILDIRE
jgi:type II secretory pathway component PulC